MQREFGLTPEGYQVLLEKQGGGCALCGRPRGKRRLSIDHDHARPGTHRGILCQGCNTALGYLENEAWLAVAGQYLEIHR